MVAYWKADQTCAFANDAYREWFGRTPDEMLGMTMAELLGPIYPLNLPYIQAALAGRRQVFERRITLPTGEVKDSIATYTPDIVDGKVMGFSAHVADVTKPKQRERALSQLVTEAIAAIEKSKRSFKSKELGVLRERLEEISAKVETERASRAPFPVR